MSEYIEWGGEPDRETLTQAADVLELDPAKAKLMFESLAQRGSPTSMFYLGEIYRVGLGCKADPVEAEHWFREASARGSLFAWYSLGVLYLSTHRYDLALEPLHTAAAQGYAPALNMLGQVYASGMGVEVDINKAKKFFVRASSKGHVLAKARLGRLLRKHPEDTIDKINGYWLFFVSTIEFAYTTFREGLRSEKLR